MKKVLALVASVTMLVAGLLVSCSDDGTQDVYITNLGELEYSYSYAGNFSGTLTTSSSSSSDSYKIDSERFGYVSWEDNTDTKSNVKVYTLTVPYTRPYTMGGTSMTIKDNLDVMIRKIGSKYYDYNTGTEVIFSSGSPESSSFTISTVTSSGYGYYDNDITLTNLSFKRAD